MATGTTTNRKTDAQLKRDIQDELNWEPSVNATEIGVIVNDGIVTLTGFADSYYEKRAAERAAERVSGVKALADQIEVKLPAGVKELTDTDIARSVANALETHVAIPENSIKARVENGWVTLEGEVDWNYRKAAAEKAVQGLAGVRGLRNLITVKSKITPSEIKAKIENAFRRNAMLDARDIKVDVQDRKVTLRGYVDSWSERYDAEQAAWSAPGVTEVVNQIVVTL